MPINTYPPAWIFRTRAADFVRPLLTSVGIDAKIGDIVQALAKGANHVPVERIDGSLAMVVDSSTVLRWLARGLDVNERIPLSPAATIEKIDSEQSLFSALSRMIAQQQSSLFVTDQNDNLIGEITREQILAKVAGFIWDVAGAGALSNREPGGGVGNYTAMRRCQTEIASNMLSDNIPADGILVTITEINNEVHRRILSDVVDELEHDGWGRPPLSFSLLVMGSSGRQENFLDPDQDNALIIDDPEDTDRLATESYFIALATRLCDALAANGFTYCRGNMMATSPVWRKTMGEWRMQLRSWVRKKEPVLLMNCDTLLDLAHVAGSEPLAADLHRYLLDMVRREPGFLRALYGIEENHSVGLDWLGRLSREKDDFGTIAEVNLKLRGLLPLIEGARLMAVAAGISETSTTGRLSKLAARGVVDLELTDGLIDAFRTITVQLLQHQINMRTSPAASSIRISHYQLARSDKAALRVALRRVDRFRSQLPSTLERIAERSAHA